MSYKPIAPACVLALLCLPVAAVADPVTYDFTGVVTVVSGYPGVTVGMPVTGTYTFNEGNANPTQSTGLIGSAGGWDAQNYGGSEYGTPAPTLTQYMFSYTAQVGSLSYATTPSTYNNLSFTQANVGTSNEFFEAGELSHSAPGAYTGSSLVLQDSSTPLVAPWTAGGLPIYVSSNLNQGTIQSQSGSTVNSIDYTVTSMTPVPLPAAVWLLLTGLGTLGVFARKRRLGA